VFPWKPEIKDRGLPDASPAELAQIERHNQSVDGQVAELNERLTKLRRPSETRLREARLAALPEPIRADTQAAIATPAAKRNEVQKYLAGKFEASLRVTAEEVTAALSPPHRMQAAELTARIAAHRATRRRPDKIQALYDVGPPPPTYLLKRGSY